MAGAFKTQYAINTINYLNDCYEQAVLDDGLWDFTQDTWNDLTHKIRDYFGQNNSFPFLSEVTKLICTKLPKSFGQRTRETPRFSISTLIKDTQGLYIATRFESHNLGLMETKGSKIEEYISIAHAKTLDP